MSACDADGANPIGVELVANDTHWDNNSIALWWDDPDFDVSYWVVERAVSYDGPWKTIAVKRPDELTPTDEPPVGYARWGDAKLPPDEVYYYRIYACTEAGRTDNSNVVSGTVPEFMPGLPPPVATPEAVFAPC